MIPAAGITALALSYPDQIRRNEFWTQNYPEVVATAQQKTLERLWKTKVSIGAESDAFDAEMAPFLEDPFRGTVERRILSPGETSLTLEARAAREVLELKKMRASEVQLMLCCSFLPDSLGVGNAAFLARELGITQAAWNLESACSGSLVGLQSACALVSSGQYANVLVVVSCAYSRAADATDTLSWTVGDGAAAFLVERVRDGEGLRGVKLVNTSQSCGSMYYEIATEDPPHLRMRADAKKAGVSLRQLSESCLQPCTQGALEAAGVSLAEIDFCVFNTPVAWYAPFCARVLGIPSERTINCYSLYANVGPVLMPTNLFHAAQAGKIGAGDLVLLYTVGSVSSAGAAVVRWGDVSLGHSPS